MAHTSINSTIAVLRTSDGVRGATKPYFVAFYNVRDGRRYLSDAKLVADEAEAEKLAREIGATLERAA